MSLNQTIVKLRTDLLGDTPSAGLITPVISLLDDTDRDELMDALTKNETDQEPGKRCKDLIIAAADYGPLTSLHKHRAKMLCDRLFQYRDTIDGNAEAVNLLRAQIVDENGTINQGSIDIAVADALAEVNINIDAINAEMANVDENPANNQTIIEKISEYMSKIGTTIGRYTLAAASAGAAGAAAASSGAATAATAVSEGATAVGQGAVSATTASADLVDRMAGALLTPVFDMLAAINIPAAGTAGRAFIESLVGAQTDSVLLILQGLMTVGAGAAAVTNSRFVISQLISLLNLLTKFAVAGVGGTVLYCIGVATNLLLKHLNVLSRKVKDEFIMLNTELRDLTTSINENPDETALPRLIAFIRKIMETLHGDDVADFIGPLQAVVDLAAHMEEEEEEEEGLPAPQPAAVEEVPLPPMNVQGAQGPPQAAAAQGPPQAAAQGAEGAEQPAKKSKKNPVDAAGGTLGGGKKHAKSQKRPRRKATKSKRSKKAGKKTRKRSRGKSRGKSHGKKH
jgi:hypothetical protein